MNSWGMGMGFPPATEAMTCANWSEQRAPASMAIHQLAVVGSGHMQQVSSPRGTSPRRTVQMVVEHRLKFCEPLQLWSLPCEVEETPAIEHETAINQGPAIAVAKPTWTQW